MKLLLSGSKNWYADGTFDVVWKPFTQLFSIHAFVRGDSCIKQVPLMFVIMSGKRKRDYKKVLKAIKSLLPSYALKTITLDFEAAMWQAASDVFPNVKLLGCVFHWAQAVWCKVQAVGLQGAYTNDTSTHSYLRKLLSLPYHTIS